MPFLIVRIHFRWRVGVWVIMVKTLIKNMRKYYLLAIIMLLCANASQTWAYDFSAVAPSGQTLYYNINGSNVTVTSGFPYPTGALTIPDTVTYNGITYSVTFR